MKSVSQKYKDYRKSDKKKGNKEQKGRRIDRMEYQREKKLDKYD